MTATSLLITIPPDTDHQKQVAKFLCSPPYSIPHTKYQIPNLHWINPEKESLKIKTVREIIAQAIYSPYGHETQFYVLLHADLATIPAQNALLKLIEEPPLDTIIILTTTTPEKLLPTIHSRCQPISLKLEKDKHIENDKTNLKPFLDFFSRPDKTSYAQLITLVESYKDKTSSLKLTNSLLKIITKEKTHSKNPIIAQEILKTHQLLEKNINVKLALENCFLKIRKALLFD